MSAEDLAALEQARRNSALAKARVQSSATALKERLKPANLAASAMGGVRRKSGLVGSKVSGTMRKRPAATTVAAGIAALVLFRRPLKKLACRLFGRSRKTGPDEQDPGAAARSPAAVPATQE